MRSALFLIPAVLLATASPGAAQSDAAGGLLSKLGGAGLGGGSGGSLGSLAPAIGSAGVGNVTGLLGYCLKNRLLGAAGGAEGGLGGLGGVAGLAPARSAGAGTAGVGTGGAAGLLGALTKKPGVAQSPGLLAGQQGVLQAGGQSLPLASLGGGLKQQLCKSVLSRAQGLVGR